MVMRTRKEAIVMDVDQVLLDHASRMREYLNKKYDLGMEGLPSGWDDTAWFKTDDVDVMVGYFEEFAESFEFGTLDAFPGADVILHELLREGYALVYLTACGSHEVTKALRKANLFHRFGDIFEEAHFVEMTESKLETMLDIEERFDVVAFVDDKPANIEDVFFGSDVENCILMKAPHNKSWREENSLDVDYAFGWYECKQLINNYSQQY